MIIFFKFLKYIILILISVTTKYIVYIFLDHYYHLMKKLHYKKYIIIQTRQKYIKSDLQNFSNKVEETICESNECYGSGLGPKRSEVY
jgi:hypothetical protein